MRFQQEKQDGLFHNRVIVSLEIQFLAILKTKEIGDTLDIKGKYPLGVNVKQENLPRKSSSLSRKAFVYWGLCRIRSAVNFIFKAKFFTWNTENGNQKVTQQFFGFISIRETLNSQAKNTVFASKISLSLANRHVGKGIRHVNVGRPSTLLERIERLAVIHQVIRSQDVCHSV